jgi:hypothetical protein
VPETPPLYACLPPQGVGADAILEGFLRYVETLGLTLYPHQEEAIGRPASNSFLVTPIP